MATYVAFLRAVNVGGRKYPMAELRALLEDNGYDDVATHIQTGNVRVTTTTSKAKVGPALERLFADDRGFEVPTIIFTPAELGSLAKDAEELAAEHPGKNHYVSVLAKAPTKAQLAAFEATSYAGESAVVRERAVHLFYETSYHEAKLTTVVVERHLGVATNRNARQIALLAQKWGTA